jgi:hypothetical protein
MVTRGGVNGSLKFLLKYLAAVPKSNPKNKHMQERCVHEPTSGWVPPVMTKRHSRKIENQWKQVQERSRDNSKNSTVLDYPA